MFAAAMGATECCLTLIEHGADLQARDAADKSAADHAIDRGHLELGRWLAKLEDVGTDDPFTSLVNPDHVRSHAAAARSGVKDKSPADGDGNKRVNLSEPCPVASPEERQSRLKQLIALGKERGYLTYSEINSHLPGELVDPEQIEEVVITIMDMGIAVYEKVPEDELRLLPEENEASVDEAIEQAATALAALDAEPSGAFFTGDIRRLIHDASEDTNYDSSRTKEIRETIGLMLSELSPRQAKVLKMRFGLDGERLYTLSEIAERFGVTFARVVDSEAKALRKLRWSKRLDVLRNLLGDDRGLDG
jgi:RNA polymerase sigma factor (sigma-70 family)